MFCYSHIKYDGIVPRLMVKEAHFQWDATWWDTERSKPFTSLTCKCACLQSTLCGTSLGLYRAVAGYVYVECEYNLPLLVLRNVFHPHVMQYTSEWFRVLREPSAAHLWKRPLNVSCEVPCTSRLREDSGDITSVHPPRIYVSFKSCMMNVC